MFLITLYPPADIVELTAFAGAVYAASFFSAIFGGLYLKWGTDLGAISSMMAGIIGTIFWRYGFRFRYESLKDLHEIIPAFVLACFIYVIVSKLSKNRVPDKEHLSRIF